MEREGGKKGGKEKESCTVISMAIITCVFHCEECMCICTCMCTCMCV